MNTKLSHVVQAVYGTPWFILPGTLRTIDEIVRLHLSGDQLSREEIRERLDMSAASSGPRRGGQVISSVGVIPIYGVIMPRATMMSEYSGGATVQGITSSFRQLLEDESVGSILFDIDSPGGYVDGVEELASEIRAARGRKPMSAISNYTMASAAYYLGSQADEVVASPSSLVGSIGCRTVHVEYSKMNEMLGITPTHIAVPKAKVEANEDEPLSDAARATIEERVSDYYGQFVNAVAKGRGVSAAEVKAGYGEGRVLTATRAKAAGLVDRVDTFDNTIRRLGTGKGPVSRGASAIADLMGLAPEGTRVEFDTTPLPLRGGSNQGGDATPASDPDANATGEAGTPPGRSKEAEAALALARARAR